MGDPTGEAEEAPIRPRGKQVCGAEINGRHLMLTIYLFINNECENNQNKKEKRSKWGSSLSMLSGGIAPISQELFVCGA